MKSSELSHRLFENGLDFIKQSLMDFETRRYKYSIIHFSSGIEVILKAFISTKDWRLIIKGELPDVENLLSGTARTIGIHQSIDIIENQLILSLRENGKIFKRLAEERNKAIHFFPETDETKISVIHYQAFEELWFFLHKHPTQTGIPDKELKSTAIAVGKLVRTVSGNSIDSFFNSLDSKRKLLFKKIELLRLYKRLLIRKLYHQAVFFQAQNSIPFPDWEILSLKEICTCSSKRRKPENVSPIRMSALNGQVMLDLDGQSEGRVLTWVHFNSNINPYYFSLWVDLHESTLRQAIIDSVQPRIRFSDIASIDIKVPCLDEQNKISDFFMLLDKKEKLLKREIDCYISFDKLMRQKMFV